MRPDHEYDEAIRWIRWGLNDCEIARLTGIPRGTIRDWRHHRLRYRAKRGSCPRCSDRPLDDEAYSYLLGLYLGDGHIVHARRDVFVLRISLDQRYPEIISECRSAMHLTRGTDSQPYVQQRTGCVTVSMYWKHWPCLFPQHGPGRKHQRPISLHSWQIAIVERHPAMLLRGLIHSDGWRGTNRVVVRGKPYEYPRYQFTNYSEDILGIFARACDLYGVRWRRMKWNTISIARAMDVKKLDLVVGPKK